MAQSSRTLPIFLLLLGLCLALRLPILDATLVGEEGSFAYLVAGPIASSRLTPDGFPQMMVGMLGDVPALYPFQQTILPYVLLEHGPGTLLRGLDVATLPERARTSLVRGNHPGSLSITHISDGAFALSESFVILFVTPIRGGVTDEWGEGSQYIRLA